MTTRLLAIVLVSLTLAGLATLSVPAADAAGYCTNLVSSSCPGKICKAEAWGWYCEDDIIVCVTDPCP